MRKKYRVILKNAELDDVRNTIIDFPRRYSNYFPKCETSKTAEKGHWRIKIIKNENFQIVLKLENSYVDVSRSSRTNAPYLHVDLIKNSNDVYIEFDFHLHTIDKIAYVFLFMFPILLAIGGVLLSLGNFAYIISFAFMGILLLLVPAILLIREYSYRKIRKRVFEEILSKNFEI